MISKETIASVKEKNPSLELYKGAISFNDAKKQKQKLEFIYRKPSVADMEVYNKAASKNGITAQSNLLHSLIVFPEEAREITDKLMDYPPVVASFVNEAILPFFGTEIEAESSQI